MNAGGWGFILSARVGSTVTNCLPTELEIKPSPLVVLQLVQAHVAAHVALQSQAVVQSTPATQIQLRVSTHALHGSPCNKGSG